MLSLLNNVGWTDLCAKSNKYPAGTSRLNDIVPTSHRHTDVASTSVQRRYNVMCLLGGKFTFFQPVSRFHSLPHPIPNTPHPTILRLFFSLHFFINIVELTSYCFIWWIFIKPSRQILADVFLKGLGGLLRHNYVSNPSVSLDI